MAVWMAHCAGGVKLVVSNGWGASCGSDRTHAGNSNCGTKCGYQESDCTVLVQMGCWT